MVPMAAVSHASAPRPAEPPSPRPVDCPRRAAVLVRHRRHRVHVLADHAGRAVERPARDDRARRDGVPRPRDRRGDRTRDGDRPPPAGRARTRPMATDRITSAPTTCCSSRSRRSRAPSRAAGWATGCSTSTTTRRTRARSSTSPRAGSSCRSPSSGGTITGAFVAALLGAPVGRWLHALIVPVLLALAAGKAAMVLGGDGQGVPWIGNLATAYLGPGAVGLARARGPVAPGAGVRGVLDGHRPAAPAHAAHARPVRAPGGRRVPRRDRAVGRRARHRRVDVARSGGRRAAQHGPGARDRRRGRACSCCCS